MSTRADRLAKKDEESKLSCKKPDCKNEKHSYLSAPKQRHKRGELLAEAGMPDSPAVEKPFGAGRCWACGD